MATILVGSGARRCLLGIRNGILMKMKHAKLSQLVQECKKSTNLGMFAPELLQSYTSLVSPQTQTTESHRNLSDEEVRNLLLTLKVKGSNEAVLDSCTQFMRRAVSVLSPDATGKIVVPMAAAFLASPGIHKKQYSTLKSHSRMVQVGELTEETADIFVDYVRRHLPEGVSIESVEQNWTNS